MFRSAWSSPPGLPPRKCPHEGSHLLYVLIAHVEKMQSGGSPQGLLIATGGRKRMATNRARRKGDKPAGEGVGLGEQWQEAGAGLQYHLPILQGSPGTVQRSTQGEGLWGPVLRRRRKRKRQAEGVLRRICWASERDLSSVSFLSACDKDLNWISFIILGCSTTFFLIQHQVKMGSQVTLNLIAYSK